MKMPENGPAPGVGSSPNSNSKPPNTDLQDASAVVLYAKCLDCPDYGVSCNGPKLAALGDISVVRAFHRAIRDRRQIPMKMIYLAAPTISEYSVNDYFSHSVKDFKWTTVGAVDNALTAICGNRVGQPLLDHPCPASSTDLQAQFRQFDEEIASLRSENQRLQERLTETKGRVISARDEVKEDYASRVQFLKELCEKRQQDIDEMEDRHQKEIARADAVSANYLARIDEKNLRIDRLNKANHLLVFFLVCALIALTCYFVWDLMHPGVGLILY